MEIGASFDDDFFEKALDKKEKVPLQYNAKICSPKWFMDPQCIDDENPDQLKNLRHQADFNYFAKKYEDACKIYHRCLEVIPANNSIVRRECMENLARSYLHMGKNEKSLEWALRLHKIAYTADQLLVACNLLAVVCHKLGKFAEENEALECCLEAHRLYPDLWLRFAYCHAGRVDINLPDSDIPRTHDFSRDASCCQFLARNHSLYSEKCDQGTSSVESSTTETDNIVCNLSSECSSNDRTEDVSNSVGSKCEVCTVGAHIITACLLRARLLLDGAHAHDRSFGSEKKAQLLNKIAACLEVLEMDDEFIQQAAELLQTDVIEEELKENSETSALNSQKCKAEKSDVLDEQKQDDVCSQTCEHQPSSSES